MTNYHMVGFFLFLFLLTFCKWMKWVYKGFMTSAPRHRGRDSRGADTEHISQELGYVVYTIRWTHCSSQPVALCQGKAERIETLALLFNSWRRQRTQKLFWRTGGTRWKMTFNCTSLAESHPIRGLYIFPNSGWWGRAYERARPTGVAMQRDGCLAPEERRGISEQRALIW